MSHLRWALRMVGFPFYFAVEVLKANAILARDVLTPGTRITAGFVEVPLRCVTDLEITTMANLITLTPGTVTVAVRKDPATLWVHGMYIADVEEFRADLYAMESTLLATMRRDPDAGPVPPAPPVTEEVAR